MRKRTLLFPLLLAARLAVSATPAVLGNAIAPVVLPFASFPTCTSLLVGGMIYDSTNSVIRECVGGSWIKIGSFDPTLNEVITGVWGFAQPVVLDAGFLSNDGGLINGTLTVNGSATAPSSGTNSEAWGLGAFAQSYGVALGRGATDYGTDGGIAIGYGAIVDAGAGSIAIGAGANVFSIANNQSSVAIGPSVSVGGALAVSILGGNIPAGANQAVSILGSVTGVQGIAINCASTGTGACIGASSSATQDGFAGGRSSSASNEAVAVGFLSSASATNAIAIGRSASANRQCIAMGYGSACTADGQVVYGSSNVTYGQLYCGNGATNATPASCTWNGTSAPGGTSNTAGGAFVIAGGQSTGSADGGDIDFQVALSGGSGSSQNSLQTVGSFSGANGQFTVNIDAGVLGNLSAANLSTTGLGGGIVSTNTVNCAGSGTPSYQLFTFPVLSGPGSFVTALRGFQSSTSGTSIKIGNGNSTTIGASGRLLDFYSDNLTTNIGHLNGDGSLTLSGSITAANSAKSVPFQGTVISATPLGAGTVLSQWTTSAAGTAINYDFVTAVVGVGAGNQVVTLFDSTSSTTLCTATLACTATSGTITAGSCSGTFASGDVLQVKNTTACATTANIGTFTANVTE